MAPRAPKFDPDLLRRTRLAHTITILTPRYPHLTYDQHRQRILWALHEAGHFVACAVQGGGVGMRAYIRVPGRTARNGWSARGNDGYTQGRAPGVNDTIASLAGPMVSMLVEGPDSFSSAVNDEGQFDETLRSYLMERGHEGSEKHRKAITHFLYDQALLFVVRHWETIDAIATGLLLFGDSKGEICAIDGGKRQQMGKGGYISRLGGLALYARDSARERWTRHTMYDVPDYALSHLQSQGLIKP
ncbi:MAG: hypothetical protein WBX11_15225 [Thiobacillaceae bacterium]